MKPISVIERCIGLDNTIDPLLPLEDLDAASTRLRATGNVKITKSRKIEQGPGTALLWPSTTGGFHSLFRDRGDCYVINEGESSAGLLRVNLDPSITFTVVRGSLTKNRRMAFVEVEGKVFYSNGIECGYVGENGLSSPWPADTYNGPETDMQFTGAPIPNHLAYRNGIMALAVGPIVYFNFVPWLFGLFNLKSGHVLFTSDVIMEKAVASGFFVSDTKRTWFLRGDTWSNFVQEKVADFPANEWGVSTRYFPGSMFGLSKDDDCAVWTSPKGICVGFPDGSFKLYDQRVTLKNEQTSGDGACMVWDESFVIATMN